ncbi:MAG: hypothetical protein AAGC76_02470 [Luteibacter sp.]|jgi:hypothetical protein|uniref:hypothetical protein n=1 Tax=Rhodanobacteraceae TaxID=1775411 RepID=UPI00055D37E6|nr:MULTISPECIES: hypothetical protein [Rhodanobacteraceae]MDQ7994698.1 hypothetical protein [Luteibacter sp.]MDQ8048271.1 hypothetical protein [Luteibacter sp.]SDF98865.1 hypothetical protein SAMN04515659_1823 [Dyella sp. 333MFSha]
MRIKTSAIAIGAGFLLAVACGCAGGAGRPSFDSLAAHRAGDPASTDPCGPRRPIVGICRMLRPVRG